MLTLEEKTATELNVRGIAQDIETARIKRDDWWFPVPAEAGDDRTIDSAAIPGPNVQPTATLVSSPAKKMKPISKESVGVPLGGDRKVLQQQWECVVIGTDVDSVQCELHDLTDENNCIEFAEIYLSEFNEYDLPLLQEGAVFYWSIGHLRRETGQVRRFSEFRLRRMPKLSGAAKRGIARKVEQLRELRGKTLH
ncbi:hypothetical protein AB1L30_03860 [Bremerella sp. JC817]|uniref:hypothetical protein n=1 Tax=Bremerella sp. JC817 TaxID=3231756 RepID=UPI003458B9F1